MKQSRALELIFSVSGGAQHATALTLTDEALLQRPSFVLICSCYARFSHGVPRE